MKCKEQGWNRYLGRDMRGYAERRTASRESTRGQFIGRDGVMKQLENKENIKKNGVAKPVGAGEWVAWVSTGPDPQSHVTTLRRASQRVKHLFRYPGKHRAACAPLGLWYCFYRLKSRCILFCKKYSCCGVVGPRTCLGAWSECPGKKKVAGGHQKHAYKPKSQF